MSDILPLFIFIPHLSSLAKAQVCAPNDTVLCVFPTLGKRPLSYVPVNCKLIKANFVFPLFTMIILN